MSSARPTKKKSGVVLNRPPALRPTLGPARPKTASAVLSSRKQENETERLKRPQSQRQPLYSRSLVLPPSYSTGTSPPAVRRFLTASSTVNYTSVDHLEILDTEFHCKESAQENHTARFSTTPGNLVMRRGNSLVLKMKTSLLFSCEYTVTLVFVAAQMKRERFGEFRATGVAKQTRELWLSINIPSNFPIGKFQPHVTLTLKGIPEIFTHFHQGSIIVLFNPMNPEDDTYVENQEDLEEYLLSDRGVVWRGNNRQPLPTFWDYGQYDEHCLDTALLLLSSLGPDDCRSAALVSRSVISRINARDNSGVLAAGYSGSLNTGVHPCRWTGSAPILQKFFKTRFPVKFGQCYVFSAVAVSALRALGIAARPVTCYNCATESESKGIVQQYFTSDGDIVHNLCKDKIWIYHVWVEAWMRREEMGMGFDGWQALDSMSTPKLSGQYRIGPAPVVAISKNLTGRSYPYNVEIIRDEIVYDVHYLQIASEANQSLSAVRHASLIYIDHEAASPLILTSHQKYGIPVDLTDYYQSKSQDGDLSAVGSIGSKTSKHSSPKKKVLKPINDCTFEVLTNDSTMLGETVNICVKIANKGAAIRQISGKVVGKVVKYIGTVTQNFMSMKFSGVINPGQDAAVSLPIEAKKYVKHLTEQSMLQFFVIVTVKETQQVFIKLHNFRLRLPDIEIVCPPCLTLGATVRAKLKFKNPLQTSLTRVNFLVQGRGLCSMRELSYKRTVLPGSYAVMEFPIKATALGKQWLLVTLHCDQITDIRGWMEVAVVTENMMESLKKSTTL